MKYTIMALLLSLTTSVFAEGVALKPKYYNVEPEDCASLQKMLEVVSRLVKDGQTFPDIAALAIAPQYTQQITYRAMAPFLLTAAASWTEHPNANHQQQTDRYVAGCLRTAGKGVWPYYD
jgi:hypothetical protein